MTRLTVIVTDGDQRAALAAVRSLGVKYRCVVAATTRVSLAGGSRFASRNVIVPDPLERPGDFANAIISLVAEENATLVLPITEPAILAILPVRARLLPASVPFPTLESFLALTDKQRLLLEATRLGIAVPSQVVVPDRDALSSIALDNLRYPAVLKPARSVGEGATGRAKVAVTYAADHDELRRKIRALPAAAFPLLLQQRIVGPGTGIFLLIWNGELRAQFAHRRLCEKPPAGGVSVYRESIPLDADLLERSRALLDRFAWQGVAMVEFKRDAATGQPYLMEVNGRFWGSLQLAIDAGVDFPLLMADCALGERVTPNRSYRVGVRSRWWWGQVDHLISRVRPRATAAPLPPDILSTARAFTDLLLGPFRRRDYEEVLRWNDPRPFLNETVQWIGGR
ncbi:MAG: ATP-grasp domain-containing protein [Gemmatimonadaceae bacterium]